MGTTNPASLLSTLSPGQRVRVLSCKRTGVGRVIERTYTVTRVAAEGAHHPAGWMVELEGPCGGWSALVVVAAIGKVVLLGSREERSAVRIEVATDLQRAS
jgi:hypothetical protein